MSGMLTGAVFRHAPYRGRRLLVLLALADAANDEGRTYASLTYIAAHARIAVRHCREELAALKAAGYLISTPQPGRTNLSQLRFPAEWGALSAEVTGEKAPKKATGAPRTPKQQKQKRARITSRDDLPPAAPAAAPAGADDRTRQSDDSGDARRLEREIEAKWEARRAAQPPGVVGERV